MKKIIRVMTIWGIGVFTGANLVKRLFCRTIVTTDNEAEKFQVFFQLLNKWLSLKQQKKEIADYLKKRNYKKIAIYGMGQIGERLFEELKDSEIEVIYGIDRNKNVFDGDIDIYDPEETLPYVDAVIVTAVTYYKEIVMLLRRKVECPIESLENIITELGQEMDKI